MTKHISTISVFLLLITASNLQGCMQSQQQSLRSEVAGIYKSHYPVVVGVSPNGSSFLVKDYFQDRFVLKSRDILSNQEHVINTDSHGVLAPCYSNSGREVAYFLDPGGKQDNQLIIYDLLRKSEYKVNTPRITLPNVSWSSDDKYLSILSENRKLIIIDRSGAIVFSSEKALLPRSKYSWSNKENKIAFATIDSSNGINIYDLTLRKLTRVSLSQTERVGAITWFNTRNSLLVSSNSGNKIQIKEIGGSGILDLPIDPPSDVVDLITSSDDSKIVISINHGFTSEFMIYNVDTASVTSREGIVQSYIKGGDSLFFLQSDLSAHSIYQLDMSTLKTKLRFVKKIASTYGAEVSEFKIPNGSRNVPALLWKGVGDSNPVVVQVHGGPHLNLRKGWNAESELFLSNSIDLLQINYGGSTGYSEQFLSELNFAVTDINASIDYLISKLEYKQVYLYGGSFGSSLSLEAASKRKNPISGVFITGVIGRSIDSGVLPDNLLAFQGQNDYYCNLDCARFSLRKLTTGKSDRYLEVIEDEGHSFRKIESWELVFDSIVRNIKTNQKR